MKTFCTTGGLGDALICLAKIQRQLPKDGSAFAWFHGTGHTEHMLPIKDIMGLASPLYEGYVEHINRNSVVDLENRAKQFAYEPENYVRLNTKITEMVRPYFAMIPLRPIEIAPVCIQMTAGRMCDSTKRTVSPRVVYEFADKKMHVVLIGPEEHKDFSFHPYITNLTGKTRSILDALQIVGGCEHFIGHDGVCAYYAAFCDKKCSINYHDQHLINHYFSGRWPKVTPLFQGNILKSIS